MKSMEKIVFLLALTVFLSGNAVSQGVDAEIRDECIQDEEVALISMPDSQAGYSHPGPPELYENGDKLCMDGLREDELDITSENCVGNTAFRISSEDRDAHLTTVEGYNYNVCTGSMNTAVQAECDENQIELMSVSDGYNTLDGAHVGDTDVYDNLLCGFLDEPETVKLKISFEDEQDEIIFDGQSVGNEESFAPPSDLPYIVSDSSDPDSVKGIVASDFIEAGRNNTAENDEIYISRSPDSSEFFVPFTSGSEVTVEGRRDQIRSREFLNLLNPSFGYTIPDQPLIRVILDSPAELDSDLELTPGRYDIATTKIGENQAEVSSR